MTDILINILTQTVQFIAVVYAVGFVIYLLNRLFYRIVDGNKAVCYATGFIGTPVHELSHALMCVVFCHRINEVKLFNVDEESGTLGYVRHSYNPRNLYQAAGNYFIGVAPIIVGAVILYFAMRFLLPDTYLLISGRLAALAGASGNAWAAFSGVFTTMGLMVADVFGAITSGYMWWIFILIVFFIALHMNLSGADIKGSLRGLPIVVLFIVIINLALGFINPVYGGFTAFMGAAGGYLTGMLLLSVIFSAICLLFGLVIRGIMELFRRFRR